MRMIFDLRFDRDIDLKKQYISPGGFCFVAAGKEFEFDFKESVKEVSDEDPRVLHCEMCYLDKNAFPDSAGFDAVCDQIEELKEFFVFTGEFNEPEIHPVKILNLTFFSDEKGVVQVDRKIFENYKFEN